MGKLSKSDQWFIMETAMLEIMIQFDVTSEEVFLFESKKKGTYYIVDRESYKNRKNKADKVKVYFKKTF